MIIRRTIVAVVLAALFVPALALGDDKKPAEVQIWTIRATTKNKNISPELRSLAKALKQQFKYTGFKLEKRSNGRSAPGQSYKTSLIAGYKASVTLKQRLHKRLQFRVLVTKRVGKKDVKVMDTTVTVSAGPFTLYGGWKLTDGDALIMAVRAR